MEEEENRRFYLNQKGFRTEEHQERVRVRPAKNRIRDVMSNLVKHAKLGLEIWKHSPVHMQFHKPFENPTETRNFQFLSTFLAYKSTPKVAFLDQGEGWCRQS